MKHESHTPVGSSQRKEQPSRPQAIILAAGKGTRMEGDLPKVVYPVADRPMVWWVVQACLRANVSRCIVVVGYRGDEVRQALAGQESCVFVEQHEQLGTGHATQMAQPFFKDDTAAGDVFVLPGDGPLIQAHTLARLFETHRTAEAVATLTTAILDNPDGYGRVIRQTDGSFQTIIEQKDATPQQARVREINAGYYCFRSDRLFGTLSQVGDGNAQGEYYLTDVPGLLSQTGDRVAILDGVEPQEIMGVNTPEQLSQVDAILRDRLLQSPNNPQGKPHEP